jgi:hypothetical protein
MSAQILREIGELDFHRWLELIGVKLLLRYGFVHIPKRFESRDVLALSEWRTFALKSHAWDKQPNGCISIHHRKVNAGPIIEPGKSDMIERHA